MQESISELEERLAVVEEENIHLTNKLSKEQDKVTVLESEISELRTNYSELAAGKKIKGSKVDEVMQEQLQLIMSENKELKEQTKELNKKTQPTKRLEVKLDKKDKEIDKLHSKIEALQDKNADLEDQVGSPSKSPSKSPKKGATGDARALKSKDKELQKLKSKLEKCEDRIKTLTITADARKEEIRSLHTFNKEQEKELKGFKSNLTAVGKSKERELDKAQKIQMKQASVASAKERELEMKMEKNTSKLGSDNERLAKELKEAVEDYEGRIKILKDQSQMLNIQLDESEQGIKEREGDQASASYH